jgi:hypothetical protein
MKGYLPVRAIMNEIVAAKSRILTNKSSKASFILSHNDVSSSLVNVFSPSLANLSAASFLVRPLFKSVLSPFRTSTTSF